MAPGADGAALRVGRTTARVRYPEIDRMGVAHHAVYLIWFELGRTELMRECGCPYGEVEEREGILFPVVDLGCRFLAPARYDEVLDITTRLTAAKGARVRFEYQVERSAGPVRLAEGYTVHAAVGCDGRPCRLPEELSVRLVGPGGQTA
jgi:acyl-CoA thioester hydrolase